MASHPYTNKRSGSTTWAWKRVRIGPAPQASIDSAAKPLHVRSLAPRDPRKPLQVTITYRGGSECWWELRARGAIVRRPGSLALHDVLSELMG